MGGLHTLWGWITHVVGVDYTRCGDESTYWGGGMNWHKININTIL